MRMRMRKLLLFLGGLHPMKATPEDWCGDQESDHGRDESARFRNCGGSISIDARGKTPQAISLKCQHRRQVSEL